MPTRTEILPADDLSSFSSLPQLLLLGRKAALLDPRLPALLGLPPDALPEWLTGVEASQEGQLVEGRVPGRRVQLGLLPEACSRHNSPARAWAIPDLVEKLPAQGDVGVLLCLEADEHLRARALAVARALPLYSRKSGPAQARDLHLATLGVQGPLPVTPLRAAIEALRLTCRLVDTPTAELTTTAFVEEARQRALALGAGLRVIQGAELEAEGLGGLLGVGKAARQGPALVVLDHHPEGATRRVDLVGKGLVYDCGGLSLKPRDGMSGMKADMAGAAAVLGAFAALVEGGYPQRLRALLCLAENAIGPDAFRNDDILTLGSGRTVEVNNTDAEGRLVLGDGVAFACREGLPDALIDLATLTGAALVATGKVHAAVYSNDEALETLAVQAGRRAGEPVHPLVYAPELHRRQFKSKVADMKNSVKDRNDAQSSCAAWFIEQHLPEPAPRWLHIDIAGPALGERASGYGVGLLLELVPAL